jgi:hypothetical protein
MKTSEPCASVLRTSELCTTIIDFLQDSTTDLKSCALVTDKFTFPAQSHLFRVINLDIGGSNPTNIRRNEKKAARLSEIMVEASHLRLLVRTLYAPLDLTLLTHVGNMCLTHLNCLSLTGLAQSTAILSLARDLIALPSINWLILSIGFSNRAGFNLFFSRCTPSLRTLEISHFSVIGKAPEPPDASTNSGPRAHIMNLALLGISPQAARWFLDPQSPLDFSQLQRFEVYIAVSLPLMFLPAARTTIEELRLNARALCLPFSCR